MGEACDLLLVFADALVRSWKQVIKYRPEGAPARTSLAEVMSAAPVAQPVVEEPTAAGSWEGLVRDERGVRLAREDAD